MADGTGLSPARLALQRKEQLFTERASWLPAWREIAEFMRPRSARFMPSDRNNGNKRTQAILDNAVLIAGRTLASGMMSGMTSPARPWFRLALADRDLMQYGPVKQWLHDCREVLLSVFAKSNTYNALHQGYSQLGYFGNWACFIEDDFDNVQHCYPLVVGEYALDTDGRGRVVSLAREMQQTAAQVVEEFGRDAVSQTVRNLYDGHRYNALVPIVHLVEPNRDRDPRLMDSRHKRWASRYIEAGNNRDTFLRESGYDRFPALTPRWEVEGQDVYGTGPGADAVGDVKQLQQEQLRKAQAIDYQSNPPIQVPTAYKDSARSRLPGGVMFVDASSPTGGIRNAFEVPLQLGDLREDIAEVRQRIRAAFYADLFLMVANDQRSGVTASEIAEKHEEKMLMLGPVLERLHHEELTPLVDNAFERAAKAGILPEPPRELQPGMRLDIEFISTLAQAQRAVQAQSTDRLLGTIGSVSAIFPEARDKIDIDAVIDSYADLYGTDPKLVIPTDQAQALREQRAKAQQMAQLGAAVPELAKTAQTLGATDGGNVQDVLNRFTGYGTPSPQDVRS